MMLINIVIVIGISATPSRAYYSHVALKHSFLCLAWAKKRTMFLVVLNIRNTVCLIAFKVMIVREM